MTRLRVLWLTAALLLPATRNTAQEAPQPERFTVTEVLAAGFLYTTTESERSDSSVRFEVDDGQGGTLTLTGGGTDTDALNLLREVTAADAAGLPQSVRHEYAAHTRTQLRLKPGESAAEQIYTGDGPLLGAVFTESWNGTAFARRLETAPRTSLGERPLELVHLLAVQRPRAHPLLPSAAVTVGESWTPATDEVLRLFERFARKAGDKPPEVTATCTLEKVEGEAAARQVHVAFSVEIKKLSPVASEATGAWKPGATLDLTWNGTLVVDLGQRFVAGESSILKATVSGEMSRENRWVPVTGSLTQKREASTARAVKPAKDPQEK
ncbi:MAG: hypothetical protein IT463_10220 [Planctomycetes bacterium]|nr:hypothetical protein [Planctomycetota bacterium]